MSECKRAKTAELQCYIVKEVGRQEYEEQYPDDTALLRQALEALKSVQDHRPNDETNSAIAALRTRLGAQPPAAVEDRLARHGIPMPRDTIC